MLGITCLKFAVAIKHSQLKLNSITNHTSTVLRQCMPPSSWHIATVLQVLLQSFSASAVAPQKDSKHTVAIVYSSHHAVFAYCRIVLQNTSSPAQYFGTFTENCSTPPADVPLTKLYRSADPPTAAASAVMPPNLTPLPAFAAGAVSW